ncbi:MAG: hypothetical protein Q9157_006829 [Trypethelium eluteriae]
MRKVAQTLSEFSNGTRLRVSTVVVGEVRENHAVHRTDSSAAHRKNIPKQVIGYGYTRYQVEQAFQDAEVFLRFWEPQRGHDLRSTPYPQLLGVTGAVFANEPNVPEFCKDKNAYLYEYPILRGNTCDMKPLHFRDGAYAPGPDRVIMAADKKPSGSKQQNEDLFRTARIKACTVATFQNQIDADASSTANPQLTPCSLYKYNA